MSHGDVDPQFSQRLRELIEERGLSVRRLAPKVYMSKSQLHRIANGETAPDRDALERIDRELGADGELLALLDDAVLSRIANRDSQDLIRLMCPDDAPSTAAESAVRLGVEYLSQPPAAMMSRATAARRQAVEAMRRGARPGPETSELLLAIGRLSGVLAYAALDLGDPAAAAVHCEAAWQFAEAAGHNGLRAWVRGTQSLVERFAGDDRAALRSAEDGLRYAHSGAARARLLCGVAQSYANLGDARSARVGLAHARDVFDDNGTPPGLLGFSRAKLAYYFGSALICLEGGGADARQAVEECRRAIELWSAGPADERSLDDEALAHVYLATAHLQVHELEAGVEALAPVLDLPEERKISWIAKRLAPVEQLLAGPPYRRDLAAMEAGERIRAYRQPGTPLGH